MLGTRFGYYSTDSVEQWRIDSTIDAVSDLQSQMYKFAFESDEEKKKVAGENFFTNVFPAFCAIIDKRIQSNCSQKYAVGERVTIADFSLGGYFYSTAFNSGNAFQARFAEVLESFPVLKEYATGLGTEFKEHLETRPSPRPF